MGVCVWEHAEPSFSSRPSSEPGESGGFVALGSRPPYESDVNIGSRGVEAISDSSWLGVRYSGPGKSVVDSPSTILPRLVGSCPGFWPMAALWETFPPAAPSGLRGLSMFRHEVMVMLGRVETARMAGLRCDRECCDG